jgi:exodeoxyribonuclease VII large subunit
LSVAQHRCPQAPSHTHLSPIRTIERISRANERLEAVHRRQQAAFEGLLSRRRHRLEAQGQMLASLSYHSVLGRGFALVRDASGGAVRSIAGLSPGAAVDIELADGHAAAVVNGADTADETGASSHTAPQSEKGRATRPPHNADLRIRPSPRRRSSDRDSGGQGSLF